MLRESATLAFTFWKAHAADFGLDAALLADADFHVHFPAAAQPKEGTSAGLPIALAMASLLAGRQLPEDMPPPSARSRCAATFWRWTASSSAWPPPTARAFGASSCPSATGATWRACASPTCSPDSTSST